MNIFVTSTCPYESADYLDDKRVISQIKESGQLLATALQQFDIEDGPRAAAHPHHPCTKWVAADLKHAKWLHEHMFALLWRYNSSSGKIHKYTNFCNELDRVLCDVGLLKDLTFANCARRADLGIDFTMVDEVDLAYKQYLAARWESDKREPTFEYRKRAYKINAY